MSNLWNGLCHLVVLFFYTCSHPCSLWKKKNVFPANIWRNCIYFVQQDSLSHTMNNTVFAEMSIFWLIQGFIVNKIYQNFITKGQVLWKKDNILWVPQNSWQSFKILTWMTVWIKITGHSLFTLVLVHQQVFYNVRSCIPLEFNS